MCKNAWQRGYLAGLRRFKPVPPPVPDDRGYVTRCLIWQGATAGKGYGHRTVNGASVYAHRHAYEEVHGPIAPGMTVDHLCETKLCVNVDHLEVVTRRENVRRYHQRIAS